MAPLRDLSRRQFLRYGAASLALTSIAARAQTVAQQPLPPAKTVNILGCVSKGVELCLVIKDIRNGKSYQINAANPPPPQGRVVHLTGTIVSIIDFCQQGPVLNNIKWNYTPLRCLPPEAK